MNKEGIVELFEANLNEVLENAQALFDEWESMSQPTRSVSVMAVLSRMGELVSDCEDVIKIIENSFPPIRLTADEDWRGRIKNVHRKIDDQFSKYSKGDTKDINALFTSLSASERIIKAFDNIADTEKDMLDTLTSVFGHLYDLLVALRETLNGDRSIAYAELYATAEARYAKEVWRDKEDTGEWHKFTQHLKNTKFPWELEPTLEQLQDLYKEKADEFAKTKAGEIWEEHKDDSMALGKAIAESNLTNEELKEFFRQSYRLKEIEKLAKKQRVTSDINAKSFVGDTSYAKDNFIFNARKFTTEKDYAELRDTILASVKQAGVVSAEEFQIEPSSQNEWYYVLKAVGESGVAGVGKLTDALFVSQMVVWFPDLFVRKEGESEEAMKRRIAKSISNERGYWKEGADEVKIKDMWAHHQRRGYDNKKTLRLHGVADRLKKRLESLVP